jgi:hypothetical protein
MGSIGRVDSQHNVVPLEVCMRSIHTMKSCETSAETSRVRYEGCASWQARMGRLQHVMEGRMESSHTKRGRSIY